MDKQIYVKGSQGMMTPVDVTEYGAASVLAVCEDEHLTPTQLERGLAREYGGMRFDVRQSGGFLYAATATT